MIKSILLPLLILASQQSFAQQGSAKASVTLSPAGDFVANIVTKGGANLENGKVSAKNIIIDLKTTSTGLELRDDHAKNKYMEVAKYPEAILIEASGENGKGTGKLKFHGKENPIAGTYTVNGKTLHAEFTIKLSQYDIKDINYKGIGVDDEVKVAVDLPIVAAAAIAPKTAPTKMTVPATKIPKKPATKPLKK